MAQRIQKLRHDGDRYYFDFTGCPAAKGWAQCDSREDASYYGRWANPSELRVVEFIEGDVIVFTADSPADFVEYVENMARYSRENGYGFGIDDMCNADTRQRFEDLGLGGLLGGISGLPQQR